MISGIKQRAVVGEGGKIEIVSSELTAGTVVEVIVLVDTEEYDTTSYLLSTEANRRHLREALEDLEKPETYVYVDPNML